MSLPHLDMAAVTKTRNFLNCLLLLYYKSKSAQILTAATVHGNKYQRTIPAKHRVQVKRYNFNQIEVNQRLELGNK